MPDPLHGLFLAIKRMHDESPAFGIKLLMDMIFLRMFIVADIAAVNRLDHVSNLSKKRSPEVISGDRVFKTVHKERRDSL